MAIFKPNPIAPGREQGIAKSDDLKCSHCGRQILKGQQYDRFWVMKGKEEVGKMHIHSDIYKCHPTMRPKPKLTLVESK